MRVFRRRRHPFRRFIVARRRFGMADIEIGEHFRDRSSGRLTPLRRPSEKPKGEDVRDRLQAELDGRVRLFGRKLVVTYVETRADSDW